MVFGSLKLIFNLLTVFLRFSQKRQDGFEPIFFLDIGENTCSLHLALKNKAMQPTRPLIVIA